MNSSTDWWLRKISCTKMRIIVGLIITLLHYCNASLYTKTPEKSSYPLTDLQNSTTLDDPSWSSDCLPFLYTAALSKLRFIFNQTLDKRD